MKDKYCILSFPDKGKHYLLRTAKTTDDYEISVVLNNITVNASLAVIADTYEEAKNAYNNLKE
jgi:hypothetical protein